MIHIKKYQSLNATQSITKKQINEIINSLRTSGSASQSMNLLNIKCTKSRLDKNTTNLIFIKDKIVVSELIFIIVSLINSINLDS